MAKLERSFVLTDDVELFYDSLTRIFDAYRMAKANSIAQDTAIANLIEANPDLAPVKGLIKSYFTQIGNLIIDIDRAKYDDQKAIIRDDIMRRANYLFSKFNEDIDVDFITKDVIVERIYKRYFVDYAYFKNHGFKQSDIEALLLSKLDEVLQAPDPNPFNFCANKPVDCANDPEAILATSAQAKPDDCLLLQALPQELRDICAYYSREWEIPLELFTASAFACIATSIGNGIKLELTRYKDKSVLWLCIVGDSGGNKSGAIEQAWLPFIEYEYRLCEQNSEGKTLLHSDITTEKLMKVMSENKRGTVILKDELMDFLGSTDKRYSSGDSTDKFLEIWSNKIPPKTERKNSPTERIRDPFLAIVGSTQFDRLNEFAKKKYRYSGFTYRWLFAYPEPARLKTRKKIRMPDSKLEERYSQLITGLIDLSFEIENYVIKPSEEIYSYYNEYSCDIADMIDQSESEFEKKILKKLDIYFARFVLILTMLDFALSNKSELPTEVTKDTVDRAFMLVKYFYANAQKAHNEFANKPEDDLSSAQRLLIKLLPDEFETRQAIDIGMQECALSEKTTKRFIANRRYFSKIKHGIYRKAI